MRFDWDLRFVYWRFEIQTFFWDLGLGFGIKDFRFDVCRFGIWHVRFDLGFAHHCAECTVLLITKFVIFFNKIFWKELESVQQERDLGVITTSDLKSSSQCLKSAATARKVIRMVRRTFRNLDVSDFRLIYKTYIRPHLEFCIQACLHILSKIFRSWKMSRKRQQIWFRSWGNTAILIDWKW